MRDYKQVCDISNSLIKAVEARDNVCMQKYIDELEQAYKVEFAEKLDSYDALYAFVLMNLASARYLSYNNMFKLTHARYDEVANRMEGIRYSGKFSETQLSDIERMFSELEKIHKATPERHQNLVVNRCDTRCCLCRTLPANKTGSHMVPNFLAHPSFSWDGKGKRFREALNHDFLNAGERNCQFYGRDVPEWRFAQGEGKEEVTDEDIEKNVNQLEYDNEFCSLCENRFGVLETFYSQFYNGTQKTINPRVAYIFWLSVLWRMSMGSMSIFMEVNDELSLRRLLDENMLDTASAIAKSDTDLGDWKYAIFRAEGLRDGDKGIFGYRKECSPYVVMYNDLVMVFYHNMPADEELCIGPIQIERDNLNDWHTPERCVKVDRRFFMDVRDWIVESSYDFYDPSREKALQAVREHERSEDKVISDSNKADAIKVARLCEGPKSKIIRLHKMQRIFVAWMKKKEAAEKGESYDPLQDEEVFLLQKDFDKYYADLACLSRSAEHHDVVHKFPFYEEARKFITDDDEWKISHDDSDDDKEYDKAMSQFISGLSPKQLDRFVNGVQEPYVNPDEKIGRNDPCPCGSGKKYKKCCGR